MFQREEKGLICCFCGAHIPHTSADIALLIRRECCEERHEFTVCESCLERSLTAIGSLSVNQFGKQPHACPRFRRALAIYI
jgi:biotin synthase-related radical SAM superfamily protein